MTRNAPQTVPAFQSGHFQLRRATMKYAPVVMAMVPVTAIP